MRPRNALAVATLLACTASCEQGSNETATGGFGVGPQNMSQGDDDTEGGTTGARASTGSALATGDQGVTGSESGGPKFDLGAPDVPSACGGGGPAPLFHSNIWIANARESTVSKINTQTLVEEGRYRVADTERDPSRTSVALSGNVAVASRDGGVTKIFALLADCRESNGTPGIQTSQGAADILPWGEEECIAWYAPFDYDTQRPLAWAPGVWNKATCRYEDEKLWTAGRDAAGLTTILLLDGETGAVEESTQIDGIFSETGLYGGAVDIEGNFWAIDHNTSSQSRLYRIQRSDLSHDSWPVTTTPHYGLAMDYQGRAWLCGGGGAARFDPIDESWTVLPPDSFPQPTGGCMTDGAGTLWHGRRATSTLVAIDTDTVSVIHEIDTPSYMHGISIDFEGYVWGVELDGTHAYRVDPMTGAVDTVSGLVGAYTYSDMTGFALGSVGTPAG